MPQGLLPAGLLPAALAQTSEPLRLAGKDPGLVVLSEEPLTAETPAHLLDDDVTPASRLFVRNNGDLPASLDAASWTLRIDGEAVERAVELSLAELRRDFANHTLQLRLECAGNGRAGYVPQVPGSQWTTGAIACPRFTGVRLRDVLARAGVVSETFETAIPWNHFAEFHDGVVQAVRDAAQRVCGSGTVSCRFTHAYPDGPAPYYTILAPGKRGAELEQWDEIKRAASEALIRLGGTITHHHAVGRDHRPGYDREIPQLFRAALGAAKRTLDPAGVLNPGVLLDPQPLR
jgi:alkyldihydroxyacetonephosphate synthase